MNTLVFIHGGIQGGWCWDKVRPHFEKSHRILTPCLSGLGSLAHFHNPQVNLSTHIEDIVRIIDQNPSNDLILIAHSYGGMVATGAAALRPYAMSRIVYIDAVLAESGQSMATAIEPTVWEAIQSKQRDWEIPAMGTDDFGLRATADKAFVKNRSTPQSAACFTEPLVYDETIHSLIPAYFIKCKQAPFLLNMKDRAQKWGISYEEIDSGHFPMIETPEFLATLIQKLGYY